MTASIDPSTRFVLPPEAPYLRNLAALWAVEPQLAAAIESAEPDPRHHVEPTASGPPTLRVQAGDGRTVYLHSRHRPAEEADRLLQNVAFDRNVAFFIHGLGLGYHLEQAFDRASDEAIFCIFEPDLALMRRTMETRDLSELIRSRRLLFVWREDKSDLIVRLQPHTAQLSVGIQTVRHMPSIQLQPAFHRQMEQWLEEFGSYCRTNLQTLVINGRRTAENLARNIGWYAATPCVSRLKDCYRGWPAIIVSAGPSLRRNKHLLSGVAGRAVIIAVQTTLKPLLEMGIEPHFVTSLDYSDICTRFFEGLPRGLRTELVAEPKATSRIFAMHPGPLTLLGNEFADRMVPELGLSRMRLQAGATVAHLAFYVAEHIGCDPIIFIGQDLGFSDGLCYAPGTSYEDVWRPELSRFCTVEMKQWEQIVRDRPILRKIPDHLGRPMYTEERLFTYLQQFERDFLRSNRKIIDATEGGAAKRGAGSMTLAEAIERHCTEPLPSIKAAHPGLCWDRLAACVDSLRRRRDEAAQIERISRETLPLLEQIHKRIDDQPHVNRLIARIDGLRAQMDRLTNCYELIMQLTQLTELRRFERDRQLAAGRVSGLERQRRQVERDIDNVRSVADAAVEFQKLMDEVIAHWGNMAQRLDAGVKA